MSFIRRHWPVVVAGLLLLLNVELALFTVGYVRMVMALQSSAVVDLPVPSPTPTSSGYKAVTINVAADRTVSIDGQPLSMEQLKIVLTTTHPDQVLIRADKAARYEFLRTLFETIGQAGIKTVTFATVDKPGN